MFNQYPYLNVEDLNLDYILKAIRDFNEKLKTFFDANEIKISDPIEWSITSEYGANTIVIDSVGNAYLSKKIVPAGIDISNGEYWLVIFNYIDYIKSFNSNLTRHSEYNTDRATAAYSIDDWLIWNDILYVVKAAISPDDLLTVGTNIERATVEDLYKTWVTQLTSIVAQYKLDIDASELAFTTNLQQQFDQVLAGVTVDSEVINARVGWDDHQYSTLKNSIVGQIEQNRNEIIGDTGLYDTSVLVAGSSINWNNGSFSAASTYKRTDYINIHDEVNEITIKVDDVSGNCIVAFYYSDNTYIGRRLITTDGTYTVQVPSSAVKFAISINNAGSFEVRDVIPTVRNNESAIGQEVRNNLLVDQFKIGYDKLASTRITISGYQEILLTDLPHNIIEMCSSGGSQNSVTFTFSGDNVRLNGQSATSFYANFMYKSLPKGRYYVTGAVASQTTIRISGGGVSGTRYDTGTGQTFNVIDDTKPVAIDIGILRDVNYTNSDFMITISATLDDTIKGPVPKNGFTLYVKDENNNVKEYLIDETVDRLTLYSMNGYFDIYTTSANIMLTGLIPKDSYYLIDSLEKPFEYSGKNALILGDSIAMGYWAGVTHTEYFGKFFKEKANLASVTNVAVGGAQYYGTDPKDLTAQLSGVTLSNYDVIIILCGTNDYAQGTSEANFTAALGTIGTYIDTYKDPDAQVVILTPNGRTAAPHTFALPLDKYREMITTWALTHGYAVLDGRKLGIPDKTGSYTSTVLHDGIHPNELGHHVIADTMTKLL